MVIGDGVGDGIGEMTASDVDASPSAPVSYTHLTLPTILLV